MDEAKAMSFDLPNAPTFDPSNRPPPSEVRAKLDKCA